MTLASRNTTSPVRTGSSGAPLNVIEATGLASTSMAVSLEASSAETVRVVRPALTRVSTPRASTLATDGSALLQATSTSCRTASEMSVTVGRRPISVPA